MTSRSKGTRSSVRRSTVASLLVCGFLGPAVALPVKSQDPVEVVREYIETHQGEIVLELRDLLTIPNVASDSLNTRRNAETLVAMLQARGVSARMLETGGPPVVYGEIGDPDRPVILFYCHYDGQPANPEKWSQESPWTPILRTGAIEGGGEPIDNWPEPGSRVNPEWRIYARSASDDKAPIVALMRMLDAWRAADVPFRNRLKFLFEGEEEAGSNYLAAIVREHRELLTADLVVMADGPIHPSGRPTADFGLRGMVGATLTMYGPAMPLHSGHYGNWAPNPAMRLAQLLTTMKAPDGQILVAGWEDDMIPLGSAEREAWNAYPHDDRSRRLQLQLGSLDGSGATRQELIALPSLNVRGLQSMFVGEQARTIIPDVAIAELDLRLVAGNDPQRQVQKLIRHIERQGYTVVDEDPDSTTRVNTPRLVKVTAERGYPAGRTALSQPAAQGVIAALGRTGLGRPVISPTMGGSGPAYVYTDILHAPFVVVPTVNHDNNQHAANENVRVANIFRGMQILAAVASADLRLVP